MRYPESHSLFARHYPYSSPSGCLHWAQLDPRHHGASRRPRPPNRPSIVSHRLLLMRRKHYRPPNLPPPPPKIASNLHRHRWQNQRWNLPRRLIKNYRHLWRSSTKTSKTRLLRTIFLGKDKEGGGGTQTPNGGEREGKASATPRTRLHQRHIQRQCNARLNARRRYMWYEQVVWG